MIISVILPLAEKEDLKKIKRCLGSLAKQTVKEFELLIVTFPFLAKKKAQLLKKYPFVKTITGPWNKAEARNIGAKKAQGQYLFFIDADHQLDPQALKQAVKLIKKNRQARTIIVPEKVKPLNFFTRMRSLEKKLNLANRYYLSPRIIEKKLFKKIGGFDEQLNILDDWTIYLRLKKERAKFFYLPPLLETDELTTIKKTVFHKYNRGRQFPLLKKKYPRFKEVICPQRLTDWIKQYPLLLTDLPASLALVFLKIFDWLLVGLGGISSFLIKKNQAETNWYQKKEIAQSYDQLRSATNFQLFKNFCEQQSLKKLLRPRPKKILEIGAGTGRITRFLVKMKIQVLPTDPSPAMISQFRQKKGLPKPICLAAENLSPKMGRFNCVLGIRVIWHIKDEKKQRLIFKKTSSATKKYVIFDFASAQKYKNPFFYPFFRLYGLLFNSRFYKNEYFFNLEKIKKLAKEANLKIDRIFPLDLLTPVWLNFFPRKAAKRLFPFLYRLELYLNRFLPPGRWLIRFKRTNRKRDKVK